MKRAFTLPELLIVLGIAAVLFAIASVTLLRVQRGANLDATTAAMLTDIKSQQTTGMSNSVGAVGVAFAADGYTLFNGDTFNAADPGNFRVAVEAPLGLTTSLPGGEIVFAAGSGEVVGFTAGSETITITDSSNGATRVLRVNQYGRFAIEE